MAKSLIENVQARITSNKMRTLLCFTQNFRIEMNRTPMSFKCVNIRRITFGSFPFDEIGATHEQ